MRNQNPNASEPLERLITVKEAAEFLRCSVVSLNRWRGTGNGPPFVRVGRHVKYRRTDLLAYVERASRTSTSQVAYKPAPRIGAGVFLDGSWQLLAQSH